MISFRTLKHIIERERKQVQEACLSKDIETRNMVKY